MNSSRANKIVEISNTEEARVWVVSLACRKPKDLGYAAEMWTRSALAKSCAESCSGGGTPVVG